MIDGEMIEILDVEKVLDQVVHADTNVSAALTGRNDQNLQRVLVVDDSSVARRQISEALSQIGVECTSASDGKAAMELLENLTNNGIDIEQHFSMIISDIEMPEMDGYMLTRAIRNHPKLESIYILLHSSISGEFNIDMVKKTGANKFIQKYSADDLAETVLGLI